MNSHSHRFKPTSDHRSADDLLRFIDGELESDAADEVRLHLDACWQCRRRAEKFQGTISLLVDLHGQFMGPVLETPEDLGGFASRLREQAASIPPPTLWERWVNGITRFSIAVHSIDPRRRRLTTITAAIMLAGLAGAYFLIFDHTVVSADELLERAAASRAAELMASDQPVVYQQIRVTRRSTQGETTSNVEVWQDIDNLRIRKVVVPTSTDLKGVDGERSVSDLEHVLRSNDYEPPALSISSFRAWRDRLGNKTDSVDTGRLDDGTATVRMTTSIPNSPDGSPNPQLIASTMVVRSGDYHPVEQSFKVAYSDGEQEFDIRETSFAVMSLASLSPGFFADAAPVRVSGRPALSPAPVGDVSEERSASNETGANANTATSAPPTANSVASAELEVEVLNALHDAGADMGEPIEVKRAPNGPVVVVGTVDTPERKAEILKVFGPLASNPAVRIQITTVAEAMAAQRPTDKPSPVPSIETVQAETNSYPAEADLVAHFKDEAAARSFATRLGSRSMQAMNYLYAMRRLQGEFSVAQLAALTPEARTKWLNVVRSYARSYTAEVSGIRKDLQPIYGGSGGGSAPQISSDAELMGAINQLFESGLAANRSIRSSTLASTAPNSLKSPAFWQALGKAEALAAAIEKYK